MSPGSRETLCIAVALLRRRLQRGGIVTAALLVWLAAPRAGTDPAAISRLTLPCLESRRFLVPRAGLLLCPLEQSSSGHFSPGASLSSEDEKAVPLCPKVQCECFEQDVERGIVVAIQDEPAAGTGVRAHRQRLLDDPPASAARLAGECGLYRQHRDAVDLRIVLHPAQEGAPARVLDGFGEVAVLDHVADLQVFKGNQIVRGDERACLFPGKVLALPLNLEIALRQCLPGFLPVL